MAVFGHAHLKCDGLRRRRRTTTREDMIGVCRFSGLVSPDAGLYASMQRGLLKSSFASSESVVRHDEHPNMIASCHEFKERLQRGSTTFMFLIRLNFFCSFYLKGC